MKKINELSPFQLRVYNAVADAKSGTNDATSGNIAKRLRVSTQQVVNYLRMLEIFDLVQKDVKTYPRQWVTSAAALKKGRQPSRSTDLAHATKTIIERRTTTRAEPSVETVARNDVTT